MAPVYLWYMSGPAARCCAAIFLYIVMAFPAAASGPYVPKRMVVDLSETGPVPIMVDSRVTDGENTRLVAGVLAAVLGPFGAHRLYLGTTPKVAIVYGLTFGGFGVLPLIDLGHIIFTKDPDRFRNNGQVIMWAERAGATVTPP